MFETTFTDYYGNRWARYVYDADDKDGIREMHAVYSGMLECGASAVLSYDAKSGGYILEVESAF